ncbi:MAG: VOC family protein [Sphingomonadaceae bacterium]|nr:VOC family protein [Sphingomonadaceae bacterium]
MATISTIPPRKSLVADTNAPMFNGLYQMGFVTSDLDAAQERLGKRFGIKQFRVKRDAARMSTAHAYAGDMMVEIIQPGPEASPVYHDDVPTDGAVRLHHLGHLVPDLETWKEIETIVEREGWATPIKGTVMDGNLHFLYVDSRADLGYYQEYVYLTGPALRLYDDVPAN